MTGLPLICAFVVIIVIMIVSISKYKIHPFISIMVLSLVFAMIAGIPIIDKTIGDEKIPGIASVIGAGFSSTFTSIGIVIILGALIGSILETTGAAFKFADVIIRIIGKRYPVLAMELMGWVVSIAVFCDSGFVILNPIRKALVNRTGASSVAMTFGLSTGLYLSHVFIPPTPGPIAAATTLGIGDNILMVIIFGVICSVLPLFVGLIYANFIGKRIKSNDENVDTNIEKTYEELLKSFGKLPSTINSLMPIISPLILMGASSIVTMLKLEGGLAQIIKFIGTPIIALSVGTLFAYIQLLFAKKANQFHKITNETLKIVGPILFITAAGGVLGRVIASSDIVNYITTNASILKPIGIFFPFLLAAILKTAQGSSTVALTTTAGIIAPLLPALGFDSPIRGALVCMAVGAGAMTVSHANDSYFWVVTNFGSLDTKKGYQVQSIGTFVLGVSAIFEIFILSLIF